MTEAQVVVLAAGRGVRMNSSLPKVLVPVAGTPMILHLADAIERSLVCARPAMVIGHKGKDVRATLGDRYPYHYIEQKKQLGTGHAVQMCDGVFDPATKSLLVLYGDHPFIQPETIRRLVEGHASHPSPVTMMTSTLEDFHDWREPFLDFGRVLRDKEGRVIAVVERKDATEPILRLREVNSGFFCFDTRWLWKNIHSLTNRNAAKEYYLPDLIPLAIRGGHVISTLPVDPFEAIGINTHEQLGLAERLLAERQRKGL